MCSILLDKVVVIYCGKKDLKEKKLKETHVTIPLKNET